MKKFCWLFLFGLIGVTSNALAQSEPFYKGKTVRIMVGFAPGGVMDLWARLLAQHLGKYIPGQPSVIVQNMTGAGSMTAANYVYSVAKPDGLTLGLIFPALYFDQHLGAKEVQYDWAKFVWIGSPERTKELFYIRSDSPYKTFDDLRGAKEPPRCGSAGASRGTSTYYFPRILEESLGVKFNIVFGYGGTSEIDLAVERGELHCRAGSILGFMGRDPGRTWLKTGFVRVLVQSGATRDPKLPEIPTLYELMDKYKTADNIRRLAKVMLSTGDVGRPIVVTPGTPAERVKLLRDGFMNTMQDAELLAEAKKRGWEAIPVSGEELEGIARDVMAQPAEVIQQLKKLLEN
jgi:tripartite-type tricarboxylate transporter receptor subunit TctC